MDLVDILSPAYPAVVNLHAVLRFADVAWCGTSRSWQLSHGKLRCRPALRCDRIGAKARLDPTRNYSSSAPKGSRRPCGHRGDRLYSKCRYRTRPPPRPIPAARLICAKRTKSLECEQSSQYLYSLLSVDDRGTGWRAAGREAGVLDGRLLPTQRAGS